MFGGSAEANYADMYDDFADLMAKSRKTRADAAAASLNKREAQMARIRAIKPTPEPQPPAGMSAEDVLWAKRNLDHPRFHTRKGYDEEWAAYRTKYKRWRKQQMKADAIKTRSLGGEFGEIDLEYTYPSVSVSAARKRARAFGKAMDEAAKPDHVVTNGKLAPIKFKAGRAGPKSLKGLSEAEVIALAGKTQARFNRETGEWEIEMPRALAGDDPLKGWAGDKTRVGLAAEQAAGMAAQQSMQEWLDERIAYFSEKTGLKPASATMSMSWDEDDWHGVAWAYSETGKLEFTERMMQFPPEFIDTTIIHEMVHLTGWGDWETASYDKPATASYGTVAPPKERARWERVGGGTARPFWDALESLVPEYALHHDIYNHNSYASRIMKADTNPIGNNTNHAWGRVAWHGEPSKKIGQSIRWRMGIG